MRAFFAGLIVFVAVFFLASVLLGGAAGVPELALITVVALVAAVLTGRRLAHR